MTKEEALTALEALKVEIQSSDDDRLDRIEKKLEELDRKISALPAAPVPWYPYIQPSTPWQPTITWCAETAGVANDGGAWSHLPGYIS